MRESLGSDVFIRFTLPQAEALEESLQRLALEADEAEQAGQVDRGHAVVMARLPASSTVDRGQDVVLTIEPGAIRLFDPQTGASLARLHSRPKETEHATKAN